MSVRFLFCLFVSVFVQSCVAEDSSKAEYMQYTAPDGSVFEKGYLRQIIVQDQSEFVSGHGPSFSPTFLLDYVVAPYSLEPNYIGIKPGVVPGMSASFYPGRQGELDMNATFYEVFVVDINAIHFPDNLKGLNSVTPIKVSDDCLFYSGSLQREPRLVLFIELGLDKKTALACTTRAHLYYFGITDVSNDSIFEYLSEGVSFTALDYTLDFSVVRNELNGQKEKNNVKH